MSPTFSSLKRWISGPQIIVAVLPSLPLSVTARVAWSISVISAVIVALAAAPTGEGVRVCAGVGVCAFTEAIVNATIAAIKKLRTSREVFMGSLLALPATIARGEGSHGDTEPRRRALAFLGERLRARSPTQEWFSPCLR